MGLARIFRRENLDNYLKSDQHFAKTMSAKDLMSLGIGAVIGTGIFIVPGLPNIVVPGLFYPFS